MSPPPKQESGSSIRLSQLLNRLSRKQRLGFISAGILLATLLIGLTQIYTPWQQRLAELQRQYRQEQERGEILLGIGHQRKTIQKQEEKILFQGGTPGLTGEISRLASDANFQIESVVPQPEASFGPYTKIQVAVSATSSFQDLLQFVRLLEDHTPILKIEHLELSQLKTEATQDTKPSEPIERRSELIISAYSRPGTSP